MSQLIRRDAMPMLASEARNLYPTYFDSFGFKVQDDGIIQRPWINYRKGSRQRPQRRTKKPKDERAQDPNKYYVPQRSASMPLLRQASPNLKPDQTLRKQTSLPYQKKNRLPVYGLKTKLDALQAQKEERRAQWKQAQDAKRARIRESPSRMFGDHATKDEMEQHFKNIDEQQAAARERRATKQVLKNKRRRKVQRIGIKPETDRFVFDSALTNVHLDTLKKQMRHVRDGTYKAGHHMEGDYGSIYLSGSKQSPKGKSFVYIANRNAVQHINNAINERESALGRAKAANDELQKYSFNMLDPKESTEGKLVSKFPNPSRMLRKAENSRRLIHGHRKYHSEDGKDELTNDRGWRERVWGFQALPPALCVASIVL